VKRVLEPEVMHGAAQALAYARAAVHVMDLFRPDSTERARAIVEGAAGDADPILKRASAFAATS
jgi:hypothetical protein